MPRVAVVQIDPHLADRAHNLELIEERLDQVVRQGARLAVFPECAVSGYLYESLDEALEVAEPIPGPVSERIGRAAGRLGIHVVAGMLERVGERCFNTAILAGPQGIEGIYRKTHTLCLGVDRFTTPGDIPYRVYDLPIGRLGILICYDLRFPEPARILALQGVQMIALPTNWPESSTIQPDVFTRSRAAENHVFVLAADRVGEERGARFLGRSQIVGPDGAVLSEASRDSQEALLYDIEPSIADVKNVVVRAGFHEMDCMADRRPDLYAPIAADRQLTEVR